MERAIINIICAFLSSVGFSIVFNVPKRYYFSCGVVGAVGWFGFELVSVVASPFIALFVGTLLLVFVSRMLTIRMRCPITIFLLPGVIPLVPGAKVYYTVYYLVTDQLSEAAYAGMDAIKMAFAIVIGMVCIVAIPRQVFQPIYWKERKEKRGNA